MPESITRAAVYPPIGIARVGNSPEYYLAPEVPGHAAFSPGGYKDRRGRVKKQVVRFRVYGLDDQGRAVKELTTDDAEIERRVHVANRKAAWYQFNNALDLEGLAVPASFRNANVGDRSQLSIDPGPRTISGRSVRLCVTLVGASVGRYSCDVRRYDLSVFQPGAISERV